MKVKAKLTGSKSMGYVLTVSNDSDGFRWDQSLVEEELIAIREAINKKIK